MTNDCASQQSLNLTFIPMNTDKFFLPLSTDNVTAEDCVFVSLGIGGEITAELTMRKRYPACQFFGADPLLQTAKAYEAMGPFFLVAVDEVRLFLPKRSL